MPIIIPDELEAGAVVPQCLDNQYVAPETFATMIDSNLTYSAELIRSQRAQAVQREFIRSLVYAPQVVVNRAFFRNNEFLYKMYLPENTGNLDSFVELMRCRAILPFLGRESSLADSVPFDTSKEGDRACSKLMERISNDFAGVKFSRDDRENDNIYSDLERRFGDYFFSLYSLASESRMEMARELFTAPELLSDEGVKENFNESLYQLADFATEHAKNYQRALMSREKDPSLKVPRRLLRDQVYEEFFIDNTVGVASGKFRSVTGNQREVLFAIKNLVDLRYNSNLPDMLNRYTFTPFGMPSRMALQDEHVPGSPRIKIEEMIDIVDHLRQEFMIDYQQGARLPMLEELTLADVVKIRNLPQWGELMEVQSQILKDPFGQCKNLPELHRKFADLQVAIATCCRDRLSNMIHPYKFAVTLIINIGGILIPLVFGDSTGWVDNILGPLLPQLIPERTRGMIAKLAFYAVDCTLGEIDRNRSWTVQIARSNEVFDRGYFCETVRRIQKTVQKNVGLPGILADQGKE